MAIGAPEYGEYEGHHPLWDHQDRSGAKDILNHIYSGAFLEGSGQMNRKQVDSVNDLIYHAGRALQHGPFHPSFGKVIDRVARDGNSIGGQSVEPSYLHTAAQVKPGEEAIARDHRRGRF